MNNTQDYINVAKGISDFGILIIISAIFLVLSGSLMIACFRWFKSIMNKLVTDNNQHIASLLEETKEQNVLLTNLSESLKPETMLRLKSICSAFFDLAAERVCRLIDRVREENNIDNREATEKKVKSILHNLHYDRNSRFDSFSYRGKRLSELTSPEWVDWVYVVFIQELYSDTLNHERTYTNIRTVYDRIKIDFYKKLQ